MPSQAWIDASKRSDRRPVLWMSVESVNAIKPTISGSDWSTSPTLTNVNTASPLDPAGSVILATDGTEPHSGTYTQTDATVSSAAYDFGGSSTSLGRTAPNSRVTGVALSTTVVTGGLHPKNQILSLELSRDGGPYITVWSQVITVFPTPLAIDPGPLAKGHYDLRLVLSGGVAGVGEMYILSIYSVTWTYQTRYLASGFLRSKVIDLGSVPTVPSVFSATDYTSAAAGLSYSARGSSDDLVWTELGTVVDGGLLAPYRFYQFDVAFASDGLETPVLSSLGLSGGDNQYLHFSTHEDTPVKGAKPYLSISLGTLNSKLELMKLGSTGEVSPHLMYLQDTFEMIRDGYLRNKAVCLRSGYLGLAEADYEPIFTGLWYDYVLDHTKHDLTVKTRTILSRLQKVQLPKEIAQDSTRDDTTCPVVEWIDKNIIFVMLDLLDQMGIQDRYIDRTSFNSLWAPGAPRSGADWTVSRRLDKDSKEDIVKLLEELVVLSGVFILQLPDGRLRACLYDASAPIVLEISKDVATFSPVDGGQADLYTRQQICYGLRHVDDLETGTARGGWTIDQDVSRNDSMIWGGVTWYCIQSHRTTMETLPGFGALYRAYWAAEWSMRNYVAGEVCLHDGPLYTCSTAHTADATTEPGRGEFWRTKWVSKPTKNGSSASDFYSATTLINQAAEVAWGLNADVPFGDPDYLVNPGYQKTVLDKWNASTEARQALAVRMDGWFASPKMKFKASNLPPQMWAGENKEELLGAMVGVSGLMLPSPGAVWDTPCDKKKFFVVGKTLDPGKCVVSLDLLEV